MAPIDLTSQELITAWLSSSEEINSISSIS
jgi:hypothetical protein